MKTIWGVDLGGTKIEGVVLTETFEVLERQRLPTEQQFGYKHVINQIAQLIDQLQQTTGYQPNAVGIATPGTLDPILNTMKNSNTTCLNHQPLHVDLAKRLGVPVKLANDANCFALAEARMGIVPDVMPDAQVVFGVIIGTGVGGGVVVNGQVITGRQGIGGEWGHNFLDVSGGPCYCGKVGCVENVISGTALQKYYYRLTGVALNMKQIVQRYRAGIDTAATATMNRLFQKFGEAIAVIINILDPDAIVLGGGLGNIEELYTKGVAEVQQHLFNHRMDTVFLKPKLGDSAGVFGGAMLVA